jgi:hypothetical protein
MRIEALQLTGPQRSVRRLVVLASTLGRFGRPSAAGPAAERRCVERREKGDSLGEVVP